MKKMTLSLMLLVAAVFAFWIGSLFADEGESNKAELKEISEKQDRILQLLDEIKSELQVVKIRATNG